MADIKTEKEELKIMLDAMSDAEVFELMNALMSPVRKVKNNE